MSTAAADVLDPGPSNHRRPELMESITRRNNTFMELLSLIPPRFYLPLTDEQADSKWMKNKKRRTGEDIKEHKKRAKAAKLDPANNLTTAQILEARSQAASNPVPTPNLTNGPVAPLPPAATITDLRAKLQAKLATFRRDRGVDEDEEDPKSRDALEDARRVRRGEMRDKRRKERKEARRKAVVTASTSAKTAKTQLLVPPVPSSDPIAYNPVSLPHAPSPRTHKHISNPAQALAHLTKQKTKLDSLDADRRKEVTERDRWAKAEERAGGTKVHDEVSAARKAVKRVEKAKVKSGKEWSNRHETLKKSQAASIKKRTDNIASRIDAKRSKRLGVKPKPGPKKSRPGFEGKRRR